MTLPPNVRFDIIGLIDGLKGVLSEGLIDLLEREGADAGGEQGFITELASIMAEAVIAGNERVVDVIKMNLPWIEERHSIRVAVAANATFAKIIKVVASSATALLGSLVPLGVQALSPFLPPVTPES